jgi:type II secretory pathway pseudopilin PulG
MYSYLRDTTLALLAVLDFFSAGVMASLFILCRATVGDKDVVPLPLALVLPVIGAACIVSGIGLWKLADYGRRLQTLLSYAGLFAIPAGTIISFLTLIYLNKPGIRMLFAGTSERRLTADDRAALDALHRGRSPIVIFAAVVIAVVLIAEIGFMIAVPNILSIINRGKQIQTMFDMRGIAENIKQYQEANNRLPRGATVAEIAAAIHTDVVLDKWGNELRYVSDGRNYWIISAGRDGRFEHTSPLEYTFPVATTVDADLVIRNEEWVVKMDK